jgi:predicted protein tyrosine phosphatase
MDSFPPFRISVCGIEELGHHCESGASHVLSILDPDWPVPEAFGAFGEHAKLELRFHDIIDEHQADMIAPQREHIAELLSFGRGLLAERQAHRLLLVHCHAGISRSTASAALILAQALPDTPADHIFEEVLRIRPQAWPNLRMVELGDAALNRRGELVTAAAGIYRTQLDRRQYLVEQMRSGGRGREIEAATR